MSKTIVNKWVRNLNGLSKEERGAESTEVILFLVLVVIGLLGAWAFLRDKIGSQATRTGDCIGNADTATTC